MKNLYFTYRPVYTNRGSKYDPSYYNDEIFADFKKAGLTEMIDGDRFISSISITKEIVPGVKSLRRAGVLKYNPALDVELLKADLLRTTGNFLTTIKTADEMTLWIEDNTNLEYEDGKGYLVSKGEGEEDKYLVIE